MQEAEGSRYGANGARVSQSHSSIVRRNIKIMRTPTRASSRWVVEWAILYFTTECDQPSDR